MTIFSEELRKCLNEAGLSDCGENDAWSYWYHRVMESHIEAVDRATATEQAENAKLRELVKDIDEVADPFLWEFIGRRMRELGVEVNDAVDDA